MYDGSIPVVLRVEGVDKVAYLKPKEDNAAILQSYLGLQVIDASFTMKQKKQPLVAPIEIDSDPALWPAQLTDELRLTLILRGPSRTIKVNPLPRDPKQQNRNFSWHYLKARDWLVYSEMKDC
ncbi:hypothetical protein Ciccas_005874, partial [Cichlidogyrus casuarinus]